MKLSGSTGCNVTWLIQVYSKDVGKIKRGLWHLEVKKKSLAINMSYQKIPHLETHAKNYALIEQEIIIKPNATKLLRNNKCQNFCNNPTNMSKFMGINRKFEIIRLYLNCASFLSSCLIPQIKSHE